VRIEPKNPPPAVNYQVENRRKNKQTFAEFCDLGMGWIDTNLFYKKK